ncbi:MAG: hypothetical protein ACLSHG_13220 [Oscillospiraceae bacterium]
MTSVSATAATCSISAAASSTDAAAPSSRRPACTRRWATSPTRLRRRRENKTPLQLRLTQLSRILTWLVLGICAVVFAVGVLRTGTINGRVVLDTFLIAVSLAVAAIPEGLAARSDDRAVHRRDEYEPPRRGHPPAHGRGDARLRAGHLFG